MSQFKTRGTKLNKKYIIQYFYNISGCKIANINWKKIIVAQVDFTEDVGIIFEIFKVHLLNLFLHYPLSNRSQKKKKFNKKNYIQLQKNTKKYNYSIQDSN